MQNPQRAQGQGNPRAVKPGGFLFPDDISHKRSVKTDFDITMNLGVGAFGVVKKATLKSNPTQQVAIKSIKKEACKPEELFAEVKLLRMLAGYPGIVQMYAVYEGLNKVHIVMELITGGELFDAIIANESYSEQDAGKLVKQIVTTIDFLHTKNIVHRDLKPENLLFRDRQSQILKLIDFGIATILEPGKPLFEIVGSRTYMAPEIHMRTGYGKPVDAYAMGVIMYILLCGYPPFDYDQGIYDLAFNSPEWDDVSVIAKELIINLLQEDQNKRMTTSQLLKHPWIAMSETLSNKPIHSSVRGTIKSYRDCNKLMNSLAGSRRGNPNAEKDNRRASIFGMFNIVKETKEFETQGLDTDFGEDSGKYRPPVRATGLGGSGSHPRPTMNNSPRNSGARPQASSPQPGTTPPKPTPPQQFEPTQRLSSSSGRHPAPQQQQPRTPEHSSLTILGAPITPEQEAEMIQRLKNDLRTHGKSFNKLKQDLIRASKTTNNEQLRRHLIKSAEEVNLLTNSYKDSFDVLIPALNKGLQQAQIERDGGAPR